MATPIPTSPHAYRAWIINLDDAQHRWERVSCSVASIGIPLERVPAIRGADLPYPHPSVNHPLYLRLQGRSISPNETGCYLSHLLALQKFLDSGDRHGLILEDDALPTSGAREAMDQALSFSAHWDMLRLSSVNSGKPIHCTPLNSQYHLSVFPTREKGAGAYMVNRHAAQRLLAKAKTIFLPWDHIFDIEWTMGFRTLAVTPWPFRQEGFATQIQLGLEKRKLSPWKRYWTVFPFRAKTESARFVHRVTQSYLTRKKIRAEGKTPSAT